MNIPTAEEFLKEKCYITKEDVEDIHDSLLNVKDAMIKFAKIHVEAALKEAFLNSEMRVSENDTTEVTITVSKDSILNAYPLENIK